MASRFTSVLRLGLGLIAIICLWFIVSAAFNSQLSSPSGSRIVLDDQGNFLGQIGQHEEHGYGYWPVNQIPKRIQQSVIVLEDKRFFSHWGVDPLAVLRAMRQNWSSENRVSGASTITMQIARMQNPSGRNYFNKVHEALTAFFITLRHSRQAILRHYLRIIPYANQSHGIAHAARIYFNKPIEDLSWAEIAFLSSIPQSPGLSNPYRHNGLKRIRQRGERLLERMHENNLIDGAEFDLAIQQLQKLKALPRRARSRQFLHALLYLEQQITQDTPYLLHTYLDSGLQSHVNEFSRRSLNRYQTDGAENLAAIVLRRSDNAVLAWAGSSDYFSEASAGAIDYARTPRSSGSTLKPFIYAQALDTQIIQPNTVLEDLPSHAQGTSNFDRRFLGPVLARQALANSRNIPAIGLVDKIGLESAYENLHALGLHQNLNSAIYYGNALAIGNLPTTLSQLIRAYSALANDGVLQDLKWHRESDIASKHVISKDIARLITLYLADPMARLPSFPRLGSSEYPFPVAIKTGTSQGFKDAWSIAYSRDFLVAVWIGRPDAQSMKNLGGSNSASHLVKMIMLTLHKDQVRGQNDTAFAQPENYHPVFICRYTGYLSSDECHQNTMELLPKASTPSQATPLEAIKLDKRNHLLAGEWSPKKYIIEKSFIDMPRKYFAWARSQSIQVKPDKYSMLDFDPTKFKGQISAKQNPVLDDKISLKITYPMDNSLLLINPHVPRDTNSISLHLETNAKLEQVLWFVDDQPYQLASPPYSVRWPMQTGTHRFQVKLPYRPETSPVVELRVE
ncbi:MAG: transglycosylase domain-containing protein [Gammaproteobacteria bacterium]|nr:transglycosylase domain-containing protein [Gammaproteobacteria bacterium]